MRRRLASDVDTEAARYVARMDGDWSDADENQLQSWLSQDPRHAGALLRAQAAWMTLDPRMHASALEADMASTPSTRRATRRSLLIGGAAAIAASVAGGVIFLGSTTYSTSVGEIRRVPLTDGSIAAINTASTVTFDLEESVRRASVEQGEAWFQVAKDKQRPFIVEAGRARVRAVGTAFSVRRRDGAAEILVTEGRVLAWAAGAEGHRIELGAGSRAFIADNAAIREVPATGSTVDRALAWRSGKIDLVGDRLDSAAAEFNRYNQRKIIISDPALARERLDGVFRTDDPEGFAQAVKVAIGVPIDLSDTMQIRIGRAPGQ